MSKEDEGKMELSLRVLGNELIGFIIVLVSIVCIISFFAHDLLDHIGRISND